MTEAASKTNGLKSDDNMDDEGEETKRPQSPGKGTRCGFLGFYPVWMRRLASKKIFLIIYGLLGMNQAAIGSYYVATITTFEKRFELPSTYSGIITCAWDIGGLGAAMIIAYYGSSGHKTRWVAYWSLLTAASCFSRLIPHVMYGPGKNTYHHEESPSLSTLSSLSVNDTKKDPLCMSSYLTEENCSLNDEGRIAFVILFISQLLQGIGCSSYYTLGAAYLDDNVVKNKFPFLFAVAACLRYIGPTCGYVLASFTLKQYINPDVVPDFGTNDSRWIGSWHKGWVPLGIIEFIMAIAMAFFPKTLPREAIRRQNSMVEAKKVERTFSDFKKTVKRLLKNRILMFNTFSSTFYVFGLMGYWIFMPKYIETQFRKTASEASIITGTVGLACTAIGILSSGAAVSRLKPRPSYLAFWNVVTESVDVIGTLLFAFIGCQKDDLHGFADSTGKWILDQTCNSHCACDASIQYSPVCAEDRSQMYFSACHAGCTESVLMNGTKMFTNCSCVGGSGIAVPGPCPIDCDKQFYTFLALLCLMKFLSSTGRAGNTIIQYRSVAPEDKSVSIAFTEIVLCALTFIPAPILFGIIVDSTCQVWGYTCGQRGNCLLYYGKEIRYLLNFTSAGFLFIGLLLDVGVFCSVGSLKIYDEDNEEGNSVKPENKPEEQALNPKTTRLENPAAQKGENLEEESFDESEDTSNL
ncbi:Organic anion [Nesidiocoris tenuis]|uniref:Solute carrier organic anion transporter family member n=1 Tax=Nesidiocoris tenuis TaxID=355587 RepID=A0ABN7AUE8_9HEMI|nr:Organic anion [Nesidiocoris tenuis]